MIIFIKICYINIFPQFIKENAIDTIYFEKNQQQ